ncbi:EAL domain-containing protein [Herbaspirillum rhizosphaerae]|uniref:EAL domain-containing protein n=1 Tax=Herbaspirillum rhizosphaerae TaxID=346179 RepID=UPI00142F35EA|nr:EAL domain-containing protein [Herbaspirillum rhizosphaerae]
MKNSRVLREVSGTLLVMRETFITILPIYMLMSLLDLASTLIPDSGSQHSIYGLIQLISFPVKRALPFAVATLLGYKLARHRRIDPLVGALISGVSFAVVIVPMAAASDSTVASVLPSVYSILLPLISILLLMMIRRCRFLQIDGKEVSHLLATSINSILPALVVVLLNAVIWHWLSAFLIASFNSPGDYLSHLPVLVQGSIRVVAVHVLWFLGIHGNYVYTSLMYGNDLNQIVIHRFTLGSLLNTFVLFGGAGGTLSMMLAIFLRRRSMRQNVVAKISLPLQLFNLNDILIFGYPIVFNPYLLAPFIAFPLVGFWLAYAVAALDLIPLVDNVHWILPFGVNAWHAGGGSLLTVGFQLLMLIIGAAMYYPFLALESGDSIRQKLKKVFATEELPEAQLEVTEEGYFHRQQQVMHSHAQAMEAFKLLAAGKLELWYQPQIDMHTMRLYGFEALLRLRMPDGKIVGPWFIPKLENAGYSDALNNWVINQALEDLQQWKTQGFEPRISLNLTADFLSSEVKVKALLARIDTSLFHLNLEMLESSFTEQFSDLVRNVNMLRDNGVTLAIDDFGTGYSNLALLHKLGIDSVKLDRSLVADSATPRGELLYRELCGLLKAFDYRLVAEGVETKEQLEFVGTCGIDIVQGWYFAAALPPAEAMLYAPPAQAEAATEAGSA